MEFKCEKCEKTLKDKEDVVRLDLVGLEILRKNKRSAEIPYHAEAFYLCEKCFDDLFKDFGISLDWFKKQKPRDL